MKSLFYFFFFIFSFFVGFITRFAFLEFLQFKLFDELWNEDLVKDKGGFDTPQEVWLAFHNALENEDIEEALKHVWPRSRDVGREILTALKNKGYLKEYIESLGEVLLKTGHDYGLDENEIVAYVSWKKTKKISIFLKTLIKNEISRELEIEHEELFWQNQDKDEVMSEYKVFFQYNKYTKKWFLSGVKL